LKKWHRANIAAVNYHFGSKDQLYAKVWRRAFDESLKAYPPEGGVEPDAPAEDRLRGVIHSMVGKSVDPGRIGHAGQLLLREMLNPTDVIEQVKRDAIGPLRERMDKIMRELLGAEADEDQVRLCAMSVVHQCLAIGIHLFARKLRPDVKFDMPTDQLVRKLARHIVCFSLAGISATRANIEMEQVESPA
jgi:TetR/AcrR family transcriptional regulator, regulator of cefoperazone and chloramphenicol sensitivity